MTTIGRRRSTGTPRPRGPSRADTLTTNKTIEVAKRVLMLTKNMDVRRRSERNLLPVIHGVLGGYLDPRYIRREAWTRSQEGRVDFKFMGKAPTLLEVAVRGERYGVELYESKNRPELRKLSKLDHQKATRSILLLLDPTGLRAIPKRKLRANYSRAPKLRGRGVRKPIRIIYAHPRVTYVFEWSNRR